MCFSFFFSEEGAVPLAFLSHASIQEVVFLVSIHARLVYSFCFLLPCMEAGRNMGVNGPGRWDTRAQGEDKNWVFASGSGSGTDGTGSAAATGAAGISAGAGVAC